METTKTWNEQFEEESMLVSLSREDGLVESGSPHLLNLVALTC